MASIDFTFKTKTTSEILFVLCNFYAKIVRICTIVMKYAKICKNFYAIINEIFGFSYVSRSHVMKSRFMQIYDLCIYSRNPKYINKFDAL